LPINFRYMQINLSLSSATKMLISSPHMHNCAQKRVSPVETSWYYDVKYDALRMRNIV